MAYPHPPQHVRLTFKGTLGSISAPPEEFNFNLTTRPGALTAASDDVRLTTLQAVATAVAADVSNLVPLVTSDVTFRTVRAALVGDNGRVQRSAAGAYLQADGENVQQGTQGAATPFQIALAISLKSLFAGPTGKGRFYLPCPAMALQAGTGRMSTGQQGAVVTAVDSFLIDVNAATIAGYGGQLCVASGGSLVKNLPPQLHTIVGFRVGRVLDTMRSRRSELLEDYIVDNDLTLD